jgi:hypothetical protein
MKERQDFTLSRRTSDFRKALAAGQSLAQQWPQARLDIIESVGRLPHLTAPIQGPSGRQLCVASPTQGSI